MLWTRAEPDISTGEAKLLVQVSAQSNFKTILVDALLESVRDSDYTVRAYITGLVPDTTYFYRFIGAENSVSRVGRTRTSPAPQQAKNVNLAFVSCQSYEQAYYGAWARMLADDESATDEEQIQFVLHLGDFIYERSWTKRYDGSPQSRYVPEFPNGVTTDKTRHAVSLADYRHLYKTYLSDPHLQEARARWPFISIWDDHEFSNDNFQSYSNYGETPILDAQRKLDANQAWFEYVPAALGDLGTQTAHSFRSGELTGDELADNKAALESLCIYRKLQWGKHLDIVLTDTRSYRSGPCLPKHFAKGIGLPLDSAKLVDIADYGSSYNGGNPPKFLPYGDGTTANPAFNRSPGTCLGLNQREWFMGALSASDATWKLWGNALPLMPLRFDLSAIPMSDYEDSVISIDGWAGYPSEMRLLMSHLRDEEIPGVISLSGDHHLHGASTVSWSTSDPMARPVAADFACAGISSTPLIEDIIDAVKDAEPVFREMVYLQEEDRGVPIWHMTILQGVLASFSYVKTGLKSIADWLGPNKANPGLRFMDCTANGYGLAQFRPDEVQVQLVSMEDLEEAFTSAPNIRYKARFRIASWEGGGSPDLEGPTFDGDAPFPFEAEPV